MQASPRAISTNHHRGNRVVSHGAKANGSSGAPFADGLWVVLRRWDLIGPRLHVSDVFPDTEYLICVPVGFGSMMGLNFFVRCKTSDERRL